MTKSSKRKNSYKIINTPQILDKKFMEKVWSFDKFGDLIFDVGSEKKGNMLSNQ